MTWETVIGLEVHVQTKTRSKMFCACSTNFGDPPNTNVCPVCLGLPGALPVTNEEAVRLAVRAALALQFEVHDRSIFARKNYFYPDLPKGYQISQFDKPLATGGRLRVTSPERGPVEIGITRLHLEEDAGKSFHDRIPGMTAVDLNRSGVPLMEIVSEPDLRSPAEARAYLVTLKQILQYLEVSDCNMEEGSLRVDGNLSVRQAGETKLGTKQEVKNMNSFAAVERALNLLHDAQVATLEAGGKIELTTFSAATGELRAMRTKEESHDYRYFPEPDLPALTLGAFGIDAAAEARALPELPAAKQDRFVTKYGLTRYEGEVLSATRELADFFERKVFDEKAEPKKAANLLISMPAEDRQKLLATDRKRLLVEEHGSTFVVSSRVDGRSIITYVSNSVALGNITIQTGLRLLTNHSAFIGTDEEYKAIEAPVAMSRSVSEVETWIGNALAAHPAEVQRYKQGEAKLLAFLMGAVMKQSKGKADPKLVQNALKEKLGL